MASMLTPSQIEFFSEDILINIIPKQSFPIFEFISGEFGPFIAGRPIEIPLWLAITMKKKGKCRIIPPFWLEKEYLEKVIHEESETNLLTELPFHFLPIAYQLLSICPDDFHDSSNIRTLLEDILNLRNSKIRQSLLNTTTGEISGDISGDVYGGDFSSQRVVKLKNFSSMELNNVREFAQTAVNTLFDYSKVLDQTRKSKLIQQMSLPKKGDIRARMKRRQRTERKKENL